MSDPMDIISISSSPPGSSSFYDIPITYNKVSEMCAQSDSHNDLSNPTNKLGTLKNMQYHSLSESDTDDQIDAARHSEQQPIDNGHIVEYESNYSTTKSPTNKTKKAKVTKSVSDRQQIKELKEKKKAERSKEKAERAALLERIRQSKPDQCIKYMTVILDENIISTNIGKKAIDLFQEVQFKYKTDTQRDPFSVTWTREEASATFTTCEEKHILFIWSYEQLVTSIKYCTLIDTFKQLKNKYVGFRIYLAIHGFGDYCRSVSRKRTDQVSIDDTGGKIRKKRKTLEFVSKNQTDMVLSELEVLLKVSTRILKNHHELSVLLQQITKAIAETPHRKEIEKRDMEKCWYARGDSRDCVKIDKDLNGLFRLWLQQLSQFNHSSLDVAKSIAEIYPSPHALFQAYQQLPTQKQKQLLLQNIQIKKGGGSARRIGPELSRKISLLFSQENGDLCLSQE